MTDPQDNKPNPFPPSYEAPPMRRRADILDTAKGLITGDRLQAYGNFRDQMVGIAKAFEGITGKPISPHHVAVLLMILKLRRSQTAKDTDSLTDLCGYAALYAEFFVAD